MLAAFLSKSGFQELIPRRDLVGVSWSQWIALMESQRYENDTRVIFAGRQIHVAGEAATLRRLR